MTGNGWKMETKIESYSGMNSRHSKELSDFDGMFFAFSNKQLEEGLLQVKATIKEIVSIGAGGFVRKDKVQAFKDLFERHSQERKERLKDQKLLLDALVYELGNHEYGYTYDTTQALESLDLTVEDVEPKLLKKACRLALV